MIGIGVWEIVIIGVIGLFFLGIVVAIVLAAANAGGRNPRN
jgi:hypothetical protein